MYKEDETMDPRKKKVYFVGYILFLIVLLIDYLFVPNTEFYSVLWVLLGLFLIFNIFLFFFKPKTD